MRESERLRNRAAELELAERAYADVMAGIRSAALLLEAAEPTMRLLIEQVEWHTGTGAVLDPGMFQRVAGNKNVEAQVRIAKAVCAFVREWHAVRDAVLEEQADG